MSSLTSSRPSSILEWVGREENLQSIEASNECCKTLVGSSRWPGCHRVWQGLCPWLAHGCDRRPPDGSTSAPIAHERAAGHMKSFKRSVFWPACETSKMIQLTLDQDGVSPPAETNAPPASQPERDLISRRKSRNPIGIWSRRGLASGGGCSRSQRKDAGRPQLEPERGMPASDAREEAENDWLLLEETSRPPFQSDPISS